MSIVFVHGVTVRDSPDERARIKLRDALFCTYLGGVCAAPTVDNPDWGKCGAQFAWGLASMPKMIDEAFGPQDRETAAAYAILETVAPDRRFDDQQRILLTIAADSIPDAIDALWWAAALTETQVVSPEILALASKQALAFAREEPRKAREWLSTCRSDGDFIAGIIARAQDHTGAAPGEQSFGLSDLYADLANGARLLARRCVSEPAVNWFRAHYAEKMTLFVGDVMEYIDTRGRVGPGGCIVETVEAAFRSAKAPLTVVGHSMGGNISYDVLTSFATDVPCDTLITVGSQVGLFEELKKFRASDPDVRGSKARVQRPQNIDRWINVYDPIDPFAYLVKPVFSGVYDIPFGRAIGPIQSHGDYFHRPEFYQTLLDALQAVPRGGAR